jgi:O-antigen/teichoic acid export membrane protein
VDIGHKIKNAGIWQALQIAIQVISQFGYMAIMARLLTKSDFGLMALASSFIGFAAIFSEGGMGEALIQKNNISQKHMNAALHASFCIAVILFIVFFLSAEYIAIFFNQPSLKLVIQIIGFTIILNSLGSISSALLQKNFRFQTTSIINIISTVIGYIIGILLAFNNFGIWSLVIATIVRSCISSITLLIASPLEISFKNYLAELKELFSFGFGIILLRINNFIVNQGTNITLGKILQTNQLGVFERTFSIKSLPGSYIGDILDTILFPALSEIQDEKERLFRTFQQTLGIVISLLFPLTIYLIFFSKEIILILLGNNWLEATFPLQIMLISLSLSTCGRMADSVIRAKGLVYRNVVRKMIYAFVLITTLSFGAYFYGIIGAAIAVSISALIDFCIMLFLIKGIFNQSIMKIVQKPIKYGLKISSLVLLEVVIFKLIFYNTNFDSILLFSINSIFIISILLVIIWKYPTFLGAYLHDLIIRLFPKNFHNI